MHRLLAILVSLTVLSALTAPLTNAQGTVDGLAYNPSTDTCGGKRQYEEWRDQQLTNGVPRMDAARIAFAHMLWWAVAESEGRCWGVTKWEKTGFDLSRVDVNDSHANFGWIMECMGWGVDFMPGWGQWDGPTNASCNGRHAPSGPNRATSQTPYSPTGGNLTPNRSGGGSGGGGTPSAPASGSSGGSGSCVTFPGLGRMCLPSAGDVANAVFQMVMQNMGALIDAIAKGIHDSISAATAPVLDLIARFLFAYPNITSSKGALASLQALVRDFQLAAVALCTAVFTATLIQFLRGHAGATEDTLYRLGACLVALAFYPQIFHWLLRGATEIVNGILTAGPTPDATGLTIVLATLLPAASALWFVLATIGAIIVLVLGVVKIIGWALLITMYVAGPLLIPLAIHPMTARYVLQHTERLIKVLLWPALLALQFRILAMLTSGFALMDGTDLALAEGALGALTSFGMLILIVKTSWSFHFDVSLVTIAQSTVNVATRATNTAALFASGGASRTVMHYAAERFGGRKDKEAA